MALVKPRLVYFSSRGLAEVVRLVAAEAGIDYDDVGFGSYVPGTMPEMFTDLKSKGQLLFDQVPLWEEPNGLRLVQSSAIVRYLAKSKGLAGKDEQESALCDAFWEHYIDLRTSIGTAARNPDPVKREELKKNLVEVDLPKALARLDGILKKNGTGHFVGSGITYADIGLYYFLENYSDQGLIDVSKYENLSKFKAAIEARPNISKYRSNNNRHPVQHAFPRYVMLCYPQGPNAYKAMIAAEYGGIKVDYPPFKFGVDNKTPEFLKKNPNGEVPTLESPDGPIFESNAIARYISRKGNDKGLYGSNDYEASVVDEWIEWTRSKIEKPYGTWVYPIFGWGTYDQAKYEEAKAAIAKAFTVLNAHLEGKQFLLGKRATLADIILFCATYHGFQFAFAPEFMKPFPNVTAWVQNCHAQPQFSSIIGKFSLCEKEKLAGELKDAF